MGEENRVGDDVRFVTLLDASRQISPELRLPFLRAACSDEPELLAALMEQTEWEERMGDFLLEPLLRRPASDDPFRKGDLAAGRFRVIRELGRGGMGVIYEAIDERLGERRALKCARLGFRESLFPEARAAMRVTHDNICRVYEIHSAETEQGPIDILSMELLEGETLAARLRRQGALSSSECATILRQLCLGLAAAHKQGLLHRDLKPNNVMLTLEGRAVIMDFGLARDFLSKSEFQFSGEQAASELRGAPPYIAPELWKGAAASVASDLYALGSIGYEMVTGAHPFPEGEPFERRLKDFPPTPRSRNPKLDPMWDKVLPRLLHPEASKRFQNVAQVLEELAPRTVRRVWMATAAAAAFCSMAIYTYVATRPSPPAPVRRLAILPLRSSGCENAPIGGLPYEVGDRLQRQQGLVTIPVSEAITRNVTNSTEAASRLGATHALEMNARCSGGTVALDSRVMDASSSLPLRELSATYRDSTLSLASTALTGVVTSAFHLKSSQARTAVAAAAYRSYSQGVYLMRSDPANADRAIPLLLDAAKLDTHSGLPLTALTEAYLAKYRSTDDRRWLDQGWQSLHEAESRDPDSAAVHFESGGLSRAAGSYDQAAESYRRALELEPWNGDAWNNLAITYGAIRGRQADAAHAFAKAIELQPGYFEPHVDFAVFHFRLGDYSKAEAEFQTAIRMAPGNAGPYSDLCGVYTLMGRYREGEASCRQALVLKPAASTYNNLGAILAYEGRDREALVEYRKAIGIAPAKFWYFQNTGDALRRLHLAREARREYSQGKKLADDELREDPSSAYIRSFVGYFAIRLGESRAGMNDIQQALHLAPNSAPVLRNAILSYEANDMRDQALALLRNAPSGVLHEVERHPDSTALRADPRFRALIEK
jgi:serine/threonine-protein kinase